MPDMETTEKKKITLRPLWRLCPARHAVLLISLAELYGQRAGMVNIGLPEIEMYEEDREQYLNEDDDEEVEEVV